MPACPPQSPPPPCAHDCPWQPPLLSKTHQPPICLTQKACHSRLPSALRTPESEEANPSDDWILRTGLTLISSGRRSSVGSEYCDRRSTGRPACLRKRKQFAVFLGTVTGFPDGFASMTECRKRGFQGSRKALVDQNSHFPNRAKTSAFASSRAAIAWFRLTPGYCLKNSSRVSPPSR